MITYRKYESNDYDRVFNFFRDLYRASDNAPSWLPARWEYAEYLISPLMKYRGSLVDWKETVYLWETDNREIVGILGSENPDERVFLHTKPGYETLEEEMINIAEKEVIEGTLNLS